MQGDATRPQESLAGRVRGGLAQGAKVGLIAGFSYWSASRIGLHEGYWAAISSIVVAQGDLGSTVSASRDRLVGSAIGGVIGWGAGSVWDGRTRVYALAIATSIFVCAAFGLGAAGRSPA